MLLRPTRFTSRLAPLAPSARFFRSQSAHAMSTLAAFKDYFSASSKAYAKFRPTYPPELYEFLSSLTKEHNLVWDVGCGSGQAANGLSAYYKQVVASDPSSAQIENAPRLHPNVRFEVARAEDDPVAVLGLTPGSVDIVTIAVALHWFDLPRFYERVAQIAKPRSEGGTVIAAWTYILPTFPKGCEPLQEILLNYYHNIVGPVWDASRALVDQEYATIPWPFEHIPLEGKYTEGYGSNGVLRGHFVCERHVDLAMFVGHLTTWSGARRYEELHQIDPLTLIYDDLVKHWPGASEGKGPNGKGELVTLTHSISVRLGRVFSD
ncbi:S-adenosyl-L-methionine-dependent methyltransferase [Polychytrium aggregatum]|uniref:S-adenosyl-L-methionine-dependent methyltransferase n=1 Tax=Polychytrium aggregatum TaxID=110093 RepID=UPI0022FEA2EA|nr:S-adenosyl-L-methionine-dependent methyltransferase [Polychytrium aggregatum]KAI9203035.1 S-adenosyl-L-methionine-dependent methyltransferase [Polychytrium aggregatum]